MAESYADWASDGVGTAPEVHWTFCAESRLRQVSLAWEADEVWAADDAGGLYAFDADGRLRQLTRGFPNISGLSCAATGNCAAIAFDEKKVAIVDRSLSVNWSMSLYDKIVGIACDPFGRHIAVALANRDLRVYTTNRRRLAEIEVVRPLRFLQFSTTDPTLIGAAEDGHLAAFQMTGKLLWEQRLFATCGDMAASGDLSTVLLAGFAHGIQRFQGTGANRGAFIVEGTPGKIAVSYDGSRIAAATLEKQIYWMDRSGNLRWGSETPEEVVSLHVGATGSSVIVGFAGGGITRLNWS